MSHSGSAVDAIAMCNERRILSWAVSCLGCLSIGMYMLSEYIPTNLRRLSDLPTLEAKQENTGCRSAARLAVVLLYIRMYVCTKSHQRQSSTKDPTDPRIMRAACGKTLLFFPQRGGASRQSHETRRQTRVPKVSHDSLPST